LRSAAADEESLAAAARAGDAPVSVLACRQVCAGLALALLVFQNPAGAAPTSATPGRPRICLVLAGGGARGSAHIGVLKALQQMRIPIDCIAGTSMGALVGAAYATGMNPDEMQAIVAGQSTQTLFVDRAPRSEWPMQDKAADTHNAIGPEWGIRDGRLMLKKGIVAGVRLETILRRLIRFSDVVRFDELGIPFRAVATDLASGEAVVLSQGQLSEVVRASLSVPVALTPVQIDGRELVDGALTDNLPLDVARQMGSDISIVVDLGSPPITHEELSTYVGMTRQIINILIAQNEKKSRELLRPGDIVIHPDLAEFSAADFDHWAAPIPAGEAAALELRERLASLALSEQDYAAWDASRRREPPPSDRRIDEVRLPALQRVNPQFVAGALHARAGEPLDSQQLETDLRRLYANGDFERVSYGLLEEQGHRVLRIDAVEKSWGPNFLRFGLEGGTDLRGESRFELFGSLQRTWIDALGAQWRMDLQLGYEQRLATQFYQPLDLDQVLFVAPYLELQRGAQDIFADDRHQARYVLYSARTGLDLGAQIGRVGEFRAGVLSGRLDQRLDQGAQGYSPGPAHVREGAFRVRLRLDDLDRTVAPREGFAASSGLLSSRGALGGAFNYSRWDTDAVVAHSLGASTLEFGADFGGRLGSEDLPRYQVFRWGGFLHQSGFRIGSLDGQSLQFARAVYRYELAPLPLLDRFYAGFSLEAGRLGRPIASGSPTGTMKSASTFLMLDSPIGPLYFAYGRARGGESSLYLYLGSP